MVLTQYQSIKTWVTLAITNATPCLVQLQLQMTDAMDNLEELLRLSGGDGQIFSMEGPLCMKSVQAMFGYDSYWGINPKGNILFHI